MLDELNEIHIRLEQWTNNMIIFRFQWHFNGKKLNGNDVSLIISPDAFSSSLSFTSLRTSHSGNYTCEASNAASSDKYSSHLLVNGNFLDFFWDFSEFFTSLRTSHSGNYTCEASNAASSDKYSSHLLVNGDLWCVLKIF